MSEENQKKREYLFDVQSPLPEVNISHLTATQRKLFDNLTRVMVGATITWVSALELLTDINRYKKRSHNDRRDAGCDRV